MMAATSEKKNRAHMRSHCWGRRRGAGIISAVLSVLFLLGTGAVRCAQAQTFTVLHNFAGGATDGAGPYAGLVRDSSGNLYGTTSSGGSSNNCTDALGRVGCGTVFELTADSGYNTEIVLHNFTGFNSTTPAASDGAFPQAGLVMDSEGNLFGTTAGGGTSDNCTGGCGTVFELTAASRYSTVIVLHSFTGRNSTNPAASDGAEPVAGLVMDSEGNLFGTTLAGGPMDNCSTDRSLGCGTVFELSPPAAGGAWTETVLHSFTGFNSTTPANSDGAFPAGRLIMDSSGNLQGTTLAGGSSFVGTVFELSPPAAGSAWTETVLHSFTGFNSTTPADSDGANPYAGLVRDSSGSLYGTTGYGGSSACGTVFKLSPPTTAEGSWTETVLYSFTGGSDGRYPYRSLVMGSEGNLYGTTYQGGSSGNCASLGCGAVFKLSPPAAGSAWTETVLHSFTGFNSTTPADSDGAYPYAGLVMDPLGSLYGTTSYGGTSTNCSSGCGIVFEISTTPQGAAQVIGHKVIDLVEDGVINNGQYNALETKLQHVIDMINAGKINGAIGILEGFIGQVNDLYNSGVLNGDQWNQLISDATSLIQQLQAM